VVMHGKGAFSTVMGPLDGYEFFEREDILNEGAVVA
jgi:hypothetical protein